MVRLQSWSFGNEKYPFIAFASRSTLSQSEKIFWVPSIGQKELFKHLIVCKQMTDVKLSLLVLDSNTWYHLTVQTNE